MLIDKEFLEKTFALAPEQHLAADESMRQDTVTQNRESTVLEGYDDDSENAFRKIERLLSVRDRSVFETVERLQRDRFTDHAITDSVDRALRCGYLDDARFAEGFIRSRLRASKGINGIVRDLKAHRIDASKIPGFPDVFLEEQGSQFDNALRLLERKPPRAKNQKQAAYAKLIRNGFSSSVASSAVKAWIAER